MRQFAGWTLEWTAIRRVPAWILFDPWPITLPLLLATLHLVVTLGPLLSGEEVKLLNRYVSAALQFVGGVLVLLSIDANLRILSLSRDSLTARLREYAERFPLCRWSSTLTPASAHMKHSSSTFRPRAGSTGGTVTQRLDRLEAELQALEDHLTERIEATKAKISERIDGLEHRTAAAEHATSNLANSVTRITRDGAGQQVLGVIFVFHGAVAGLFA